MRKLLLLAALAAATGCHQTDAALRPSSYDELAMANGHWEWERTIVGFGTNQSPARVGYTRQLVVTSGGQVLIGHNNQVVKTTSYQLSMGTLAGCGPGQPNVPIINFETEAGSASGPRKAYSVTKTAAGDLQLSLEGDYACVDGGAYESYHWVAD